ncbi:hypothetical protein, partial [Cellulosimicrobium funkei]|uniref:hypothetical protein n=1 Tax=Cellulosimicrobium funkei TaxID=264251 RepID=UPI0036F9578A
MTRNWRLRPGRRGGVVLLAAAVATTGIVYAGVRQDGGPAHDARGHKSGAGTVTEVTALSRAARTGKPVEVTAERTAHSSTWARPDGQMAKQLYSAPIRAKVGGEWKQIDADLRRTGAGWEPKATNTRMVFSPGSGEQDGRRASRSTVRRVSLVRQAAADATENPLVTLYVGGSGEYKIQLTWPGP